ncbi:MAG: energy transducer TonB [Pseudomonadota bacterium]
MQRFPQKLAVNAQFLSKFAICTVLMSAYPAHASIQDSDLSNGQVDFILYGSQENENGQLYQESDKTNSDTVADITVRANLVDEAKRKLEQCLDRNCPPNEDIAASIELADFQFFAGEYREAREVLFNSKGRNARHAEEWPQELSTLYNAQATLALHLGYSTEHRNAARKAKNVLQNHQANDLEQLLASEIRLADSWTGTGDSWRSARAKYRKVIKQANNAGLDEIASIAQMRVLALDLARAEQGKDRALLKRVKHELVNFYQNESKPDEHRAVAGALASKATQIQIDYSFADNQNEHDSIVAYFPPTLTSEGQPLLLTYEPVKMNDIFGFLDIARANREQFIFASATSAVRNSFSFEGVWADIGYTINADGSVSNAEIVQSEGLDRWHANALESVLTKKYAPLPPLEDGTARQGYIVERFTFTAPYLEDAGALRGTRIPYRQKVPRLYTIQVLYEDNASGTNPKGQS